MRIAITGHRPDKLGGYGANNPLRVHLHLYRRRPTVIKRFMVIVSPFLRCAYETNHRKGLDETTAR
jgi:hypothetical protein